ncbi:hypothetical protein [Synechococcus sp. MIT S9509]|uniref:hypothetical protein n=1 Tax=Synechococcus sp. MIT S9509 TaxID=1801630 RepID=UPI000ADA8559|nr:hypothetical protein [Synechococcus sp. MIT S9509]
MGSSSDIIRPLTKNDERNAYLCLNKIARLYSGELLDCFKGSIIVGSLDQVSNDIEKPLSTRSLFALVFELSGAIYACMCNRNEIYIINVSNKTICKLSNNQCNANFSCFSQNILKSAEQCINLISVISSNRERFARYQGKKLLIGSSSRPYDSISMIKLAFEFKLEIDISIIAFIGNDILSKGPYSNVKLDDRLFISPGLLLELFTHHSPKPKPNINKYDEFISFQKLYQSIRSNEITYEYNLALSKCESLMNKLLGEEQSGKILDFLTRYIQNSTNKPFDNESERCFHLALDYAFESRKNIEQNKIILAIKKLLENQLMTNSKLIIYVDGYTSMYENCDNYSSIFFEEYFNFIKEIQSNCKSFIEGFSLIIIPVIPLNLIDKYSIYSQCADFFIGQFGTFSVFLSKVCDVKGFSTGPSPLELLSVYSKPSNCQYMADSSICLTSYASSEFKNHPVPSFFNVDNHNKFNYKVDHYEHIVFDILNEAIKKSFANPRVP